MYSSHWLKFFSMSLLFLNCNSKSAQKKESEFECVPLDKQSALQHPLMKNHQIQTRPSRELLSMLSSTSNGNNVDRKIDMKAGSEECPMGQVPIHKPKTHLNHQCPQKGRVLKENDRVGKKKKQKRSEKRKNERISLQSSSATIPQNNMNYNHRTTSLTDSHQHYAIVRTFENTTERWRGAQALFNIKKPQVAHNQFSKAWIWLNYMKASVMTSIQFGWAVHTVLYRDNRPRLTTYWTSETNPKGCYNALCRGGYVQIHKSIYPGMLYDDVNQKTVHLSVAEDPVTKNWVLTTGTTMIGYWARQSEMAEGASEVYFGGFAGISDMARPGPGPMTSPPMGTGNFPTKDLTQSCFMSQLKYVLSDYTLVDIHSNDVEEYVDNRKCYGLVFLKYLDSISRETLTFGGPGGQCF